MKSRQKEVVPSELRNYLEKARMENLALFRGLDRVDVSAQEMPQKELRQLFELDADCAEALWALDNPQGLNLRMMVKDTQKSLRRIPEVRKKFLAKLPERVLVPLANHESQILTTLTLRDAYRDIP
jgi:hypothetical protein